MKRKPHVSLGALPVLAFALAFRAAIFLPFPFGITRTLNFHFHSRTSLHPHHTTTALSYREVRVVRTGISTGHRPHFPHLPHHTFEGADECQSRWGQPAFRRSQRERHGHSPSGVQQPEHHSCATSAGLP